MEFCGNNIIFERYLPVIFMGFDDNDNDYDNYLKMKLIEYVFYSFEKYVHEKDKEKLYNFLEEKLLKKLN